MRNEEFWYAVSVRKLLLTKALQSNANNNYSLFAIYYPLYRRWYR